MRKPLLFSLALFALSLNTPSAELDWPQWRGPARTGISAETGLLKEWPEDGPKLAWKGTGLGAGFSSVAVVGDKIFTAGDVGDSSYIIAVKRSDGSPVWK